MVLLAASYVYVSVLTVVPLLLTFGAVLVVSRLLVHRYINRAGTVVRRKLETMGVTRAIA